MRGGNNKFDSSCQHTGRNAWQNGAHHNPGPCCHLRQQLQDAARKGMARWQHGPRRTPLHFRPWSENKSDVIGICDGVRHRRRSPGVGKHCRKDASREACNERRQQVALSNEHHPTRTACSPTIVNGHLPGMSPACEEEVESFIRRMLRPIDVFGPIERDPTRAAGPPKNNNGHVPGMLQASKTLRRIRPSASLRGRGGELYPPNVGCVGSDGTANSCRPYSADYQTLSGKQWLDGNTIHIGLRSVSAPGVKIEVLASELIKAYDVNSSHPNWEKLPGTTPAQKRAQNAGKLFNGK